MAGPPTAASPKDWIGAIVRTDPGGDPSLSIAGLGLCVEGDFLLTCTHVVAEAQGLLETEPVQVGSSVDVIFPTHGITTRPVRATVLCSHAARECDPRDDICVLSLDASPPACATWSKLEMAPRDGGSITAWGCPHGAVTPRISRNNQLAGEVSPGRWQVDPPEGGQRICEGFSGGVVVDADEVACVGLVVGVFSGPEGTALVVTFEQFRNACPDALKITESAAHDHREAGEHLGPADVFISYNSQDVDAATSLKSKLSELGVRAWLDRDEILGGASWQAELETVLRSIPAAVVLIGRGGIGSWQEREVRALVSGFVKRGARVVPILLPDGPGPDELPLFLQEFQLLDFRDATDVDDPLRGIGDQLRALKRDVARGAVASAPMFRLLGVPALPPDYVERSELEELKSRLLAPDGRPLSLTDSSGRVAMRGMGGVGKTVLATALARDSDIRRAFPEGVFWITLGQEPAITNLQARLARALGLEHPDFTTARQGREQLAELLADRAILLILDDAWEPGHASAFTVTGERGRLLVTTRQRDVATAIHGEALDVGELSAAKSLELLAASVGLPRSELPEAAAAIADACGHLAVALAVVGSLLRNQPADRWATLREELELSNVADLAQPYSDYRFGQLGAIFDASLNALDRKTSLAYTDLAVFPEDTAVPEELIQSWWVAEGHTLRDTQDTLDALVDASLLRRDARGQLSWHDLVRDHMQLRAHAEGGADGLLRPNSRFLAAVAPDPKRFLEAAGSPFVRDHLVEHLVDAGREEDARALVLDPHWLRLRLGNGDVLAPLHDLKIAGRRGLQDQALALMHSAFRMSRHVLALRPGQLATQLIGRLIGNPDRGIRATLEQLASAQTESWLCPLRSGYSRAGTAQPSTFEGHSGWVYSVALSADGGTALSGGIDRTLKVWDLASNPCTTTLEGHSGSVRSVALSADGRTALSSGSDRTLKLWDLASGACTATLMVHGGSVYSVALSADGRTALSGGIDGTLKVWDLATCACNATLKGHRGWVYSVALSADGRTALSGSADRTLKRWDLASGACTTTLEGHSDWVYSVALCADGRTALSGGVDGTLKVWDLASDRCTTTLEGHGGSVRSVALSADGRTALSGSADGTLKLWDLPRGNYVEAVLDAAVTCVALRTKSSLIAGDARGQIYSFELAGEVPPHLRTPPR